MSDGFGWRWMDRTRVEGMGSKRSSTLKLVYKILTLLSSFFTLHSLFADSHAITSKAQMGSCQSKASNAAVDARHPSAVDSAAPCGGGEYVPSGRSELSTHMIRERSANVWDCKSFLYSCQHSLYLPFALTNV